MRLRTALRPPPWPHPPQATFELIYALDQFPPGAVLPMQALVFELAGQTSFFGLTNLSLQAM